MQNLYKIINVFFLAMVLSVNLTAGLEDRLSSKWLVKNLNVAPFLKFREFLAPNEYHPESIKRHLDLITGNGLLVSTGTERSFMALSLCEKCTGLVGVDINPRVKAYNDFNTLLFRLSKNLPEYHALRKVRDFLAGRSVDVDEMVGKIKDKIINNNEINNTAKEYYLSNLDGLASVFYKAQALEAMSDFINPSNNRFKEANYLFDQALFERLQRFAKAGDMVFVVEDINDLRFLDKERISAIDSSNIEQYVPLKFEYDPKLTSDKVRVIWTATLQPAAKFYSFIPILKDEKMDKLIQDYKNLILEKANIIPEALDFFIGLSLHRDETDAPPLQSSAAHLLKVLKEMLES